MRDRLVELLEKASAEVGKHIRETTKKVLAEKGRFNSATDIGRRNIYEVEADYLLENGVIVPPCKVGDEVWYLNKHPHISLLQNSVYKATVVRIVTISTGTVLVIKIKSEGCCEIPDETDWGITVFATREEAEQALKGGAE